MVSDWWKVGQSEMSDSQRWSETPAVLRINVIRVIRVTHTCDRADLLCVCHAGKCNFTLTLLSGVEGSHSSSDSVNNTSEHSHHYSHEHTLSVSTTVSLSPSLWIEDRSPCDSEWINHNELLRNSLHLSSEQTSVYYRIISETRPEELVFCFLWLIKEIAHQKWLFCHHGCVWLQWMCTWTNLKSIYVNEKINK